jgi:GNAT superfamily N-acetyltransferase
MNRIPCATKWPVALLEDVYVMPRFRHHGYGRIAVKRFLEDARSEGDVLAMLKVGWDLSEDSHAARAWKTKFYRSNGFSELDTTFPEPVMMYLAL